MTISRLAAVGAIVLNVPMIFAASILSVGAVVLSVVLLATIGAALGAVTGWATATQLETAVADATPVAPAGAERIAA
jgi:membrane protein YqaA with SNARE-associated domain